MSSFSTPGKTVHLPLSFREHTSDNTGVISRDGGCLTPNHGQLSVSELCLMEILGAEYSHHHLMPIHVPVEAAPPDAEDESHAATVTVKDATGSKAIYPFPATRPVVLSSTTVDERCLSVVGEKTPPSHGDVPGFALASVRDEDSPTEPHSTSSTSSQKRSRSAVRVRLDQRFDAMSAGTATQQDIQSEDPSSLLTMHQQSAESQETVTHPQLQTLMKTERADPFEVSNSYVEGNCCIPHMFVRFPFDCHQEMVARRAHCTSGSNSTEEQQLATTGNGSATSAASRWVHDSSHSCQPVKAAETPPDSTGKSGRKTTKRARSSRTYSQRRELHNSRERNRRKVIRSCCDELNMLVPFCTSDSDKATTLQLTTAFLRYINKTYGDIFREEFQTVFTCDKGIFLLPTPSSDQKRIHQEVTEKAIAPLALEQESSRHFIQ